MKFYTTILALTFTIFISACNEKTGVSSKDDPTLATVNGQPIKKSTLQFYALEQRQRAPKQPQTKENLLNGIVTMTLLSEEAKKNKLEDNKDYQSRINFIKLGLLSQAAMSDYVSKNPIAESDLKAEYDARIGDINFTEYKASHILMNDEATAKTVIAKLLKGGDFAALAKKHSTGPSGPKGGDLGWFNPSNMVPEFAEAVIKLKDNSFTKAPVQTQFGWHIIKRASSRAGAPPSFEQIKPRINAMLEQKSIKEYLDALRKKAKIVIEIDTPPATTEAEAQTEAETKTETEK
jgi:peptidyl-prolyl cis-trans isomerase C